MFLGTEMKFKPIAFYNNYVCAYKFITCKQRYSIDAFSVFNILQHKDLA